MFTGHGRNFRIYIYVYIYIYIHMDTYIYIYIFKVDKGIEFTVLQKTKKIFRECY